MAAIPVVKVILASKEKPVENVWKMSWQQKYIWTQPRPEDDQQLVTAKCSDCAHLEDQKILPD